MERNLHTFETTLNSCTKHTSSFSVVYISMQILSNTKYTYKLTKYKTGIQVNHTNDATFICIPTKDLLGLIQ